MFEIGTGLFVAKNFSRTIADLNATAAEAFVAGFHFPDSSFFFGFFDLELFSSDPRLNDFGFFVEQRFVGDDQVREEFGLNLPDQFFFTQ